MMLRAIYIKGFKTFARPVRMPLGRGITSVVGPNGSGKSNIADAVAWALGEQRPNVLRAGTMTDVIFSGSETLPAARAAEVTLVLDNGGGEISLPYREVALTRRLTRSGESEYRINGVRSRLQDVRAVAGEAGIGQHSILRQGAVDAIVSGGAEACRSALEEAAGLGIYRRRRHAAARRLERAAERLERSRELEREVAGRLRQMEQEAAAAREYRELESRLRRLSLAHLYRMATRGVGEREEEVRRRERRVAELFERGERLRTRREELERSLRDLDSGVRELDAAIRRLERVSGDLAGELVRGERISARHAAAGSRREGLKRALNRLGMEQENAARAAEELEERVRRLERLHSRERQALEEAEERLREERDRSAAAASGVERLKRELQRLLDRREKLRRALENAPDPLPEPLLRRISSLREELDTLTLRRGTGGPLPGRLARARRTARRLAAELNRREGALAAVVGRLEAEVRALEPRRREGAARLEDSIRALPGYEAAVEAALGELAGGVMVESLEGGRRALAAGERVAVRLDAERVAGRPPGRPLIECVQILKGEHADAIESLLGSFFVVEEPNPRVRLNGWIAVTRDGMRITRASVSRRVEEGEFSRRARFEAGVERLRLLREELGGRLRSLQDTVRDAERRLDGIMVTGDALSAVSQRVWRLSDRIGAGVEGRLRTLESELAHSGRIREELDELEREIASLKRELSRSRGELQAGTEDLKRAEKAAEKSRERLQRLDARLTGDQLRRDQARERHRRLTRRIRRLERFADSEPGALHQLARRALQTGERASRTLTRRLDELRRQRDGLSRRQRETSSERDRVANLQLEAAGELARARAEAERAREELSRLHESSRRARAEISDEWGATLEEAQQESESLPEEIEKERRELARRVNRFGDVNLLAIAQEDEERRRYEFVSGQRRDAEAAAEDLKRIIQEIDRELKERFDRTFRRIRAAFREIIPRMMAEASGDLELTEEGIEIGLRLRRKGWRPLHMLSGGERALLALSYLFSIFLARRGVFCILDEAEAALDDVNLARFLSVVDSYRSGGQFVLVTHQKRTMAAADVLYGVTVDASGASAVVSKRLSGEVAEG